MSSIFPSDGRLHPSDLAAGLHTARAGRGPEGPDQGRPALVPWPSATSGSGWARNREPDKLRGWSHGIEHMLFKGTPRRARATSPRRWPPPAAPTNAGTGYETTNYHITVPAENLATWRWTSWATPSCNAVFDPAQPGRRTPGTGPREPHVRRHSLRLRRDLALGPGTGLRPQSLPPSHRGPGREPARNGIARMTSWLSTVRPIVPTT
jgi:hypothetical protein